MERLRTLWLEYFKGPVLSDWYEQKRAAYTKRNIEILRIQCRGEIYQKIKYDQALSYCYLLHIVFFMKQGKKYFIEEQITDWQFQMIDGKIIDHKKIPLERQNTAAVKPEKVVFSSSENAVRFIYDRMKAVQYAELWWNSRNPEFPKVEDDCTNFISQCLLAGGAPMDVHAARDKGWWFRNKNNNWSFSWTVAHSMRWYLSGSQAGLRGREMQTADQLFLGDVICYDFEGDGRWDHTTIVVAKDANNMPLVNAHTNDSRHRYWTYEDSAAWTPNCKYKFFRIGQ